jgi:NADPH2:quinone reductase
LDLMQPKQKSISWHWEFMFTRPLFSPEDPAQHHLLNEVAELIEDGTIRTTITTRLHPLDAARLREAQRLVETGSTIGKVVVSAR